MKSKLCVLFLLIIFSNTTFAEVLVHPNYAEIYLGNDKFENFNRKMYKFNSGLNKFAVKPLHRVWASVMPKYGMDRIAGIADNIEYPKRLVSSLLQKDFKTGGTETLRFITNTTLGLGGMYDPASHFFNLKPANEDMDQALAKCNIKNGPYCVLPVIASTTPRAATAKSLDTVLNPSCYIAAPVLAFIKLGLLVNKTSYSQPLFSLIESNYADPYQISKTIYGIERHIKTENLDRKELLETDIEIAEDVVERQDSGVLEINALQDDNKICQEQEILPDIVLTDFNPQNAITDSMRTALFEIPEINKSIWSELSIWNRSFANKIRTSFIEPEVEGTKYKFKYIINKNETSPLAIIIPSIGEGINSHHSVCLAKIFYDEGYSVLIMGNPFQWEFVKCFNSNYYPGIPQKDSDFMKSCVLKAINKLEAKYERNFQNNVLIGTSLGAMNSLFIADKESQNKTLNISMTIAICPPIELTYAMEQVDSNYVYSDNDEFKENVSVAAAKILALLNNRKEKGDLENIDYLPFSEYEAKIITSFIMHQKLSDLVYTIEAKDKFDHKEFYQNINSMNYRTYSEKYLLGEENKTIEDLAQNANLYVLKDYLTQNDSYKIYHAKNDYLTNPEQLMRIKNMAQNRMVIFDNGAHLGFLYRKEFQDCLREDIKLK